MPASNTFKLAAVAVCSVASLLPFPAGAGLENGHAEVRLVASNREAAPGSPLLLGVRFDIEPGWHIYWRNPGGAGLATEVRWKLPEGLEAGELQWPLPVAFTQSDGIPGYGYEGSVVLAAEVDAPRTGSVDAVVGADISWLACREVCVLGGAELEGVLGELPDDPMLASWSERVAAPYRPENSPFAVKMTGGIENEALTLWLDWKDGEPLPTTWFPEPPDGLEVGEVTVRTRGGLTRIDAPVRRLAGADSTEDTLRSLLVVTDGDGTRRGWELATDLEN
jgi:DsbC/DsbD-like thiol-disulfide interchange protein